MSKNIIKDMLHFLVKRYKALIVLVSLASALVTNTRRIVVNSKHEDISCIVEQAVACLRMKNPD